MIVTCEECSTSFQLDDTRIPAAGARVRCSRCKHAFFLPNPSSSQSQVVQSVVEETIQGKAGHTPAPTRDLGGSPAAVSGPAVRGEPEEEDWQFSEEIRVADDDEQNDVRGTRVGLPDPSSFDLTGDLGRGFDPETLSQSKSEKRVTTSVPSPAPTAAAASRPAAKPPEPQRDESSFGSIDDFSSLIDDEDSSVGLEREFAGSAPRSAGGATASSDDLGDPESWDLVGGDDARHAKSTVAALVRPPNRPATKKATLASLDLFADGELAASHEELEQSPGTQRHWIRIGKLVGWCVTAVSVAVVGGLLLRSESARWTDGPQRLQVGPLVAETTRSGWLESSRAGFVLVFKGELRNTGNQPLKPIPLQLTLLDGAGERIAQPPLRVGQTLLESTLRESRPEELTAEIDRAISAWVAKPLAPGEIRRFTAIVPADQLPAGARRVLLEAARPPKP